MHRRVRIEFQNADGTKYVLSVAGKLSRDKVMKVMDLVELMDGPVDSTMQIPPDSTTFFGRLLKLTNDSFTGKEFSSSDIAGEYEERFNEPVKLSTISTYLSRLSERGYLTRQKFGNSWVYRRVYLPTNQLSAR